LRGLLDKLLAILIAGHMKPPHIASLSLLLLSAVLICRPLSAPAAEDKPNIIFILADDLGYGDIGCYGQKHILTPNLDRMAKEGLKFTNFYAGSTVCAPSRSVLMTGQHTGRTWVRGNAGSQGMEAQTLRDKDVTVAEVLKDAGYYTALIGKWGLGEIGSTGHPNKQGFDYFFGYLNQRHAHNHYPEFLIRNSDIVKLRNITDPEYTAQRKANGLPDDGSGWATPEGRIDYAHSLFAQEALDFIGKTSKDKPFFLYLAFNVPHANNEGTRGTGNGQDVPDHGIYSDKDWPEPDKGQAAMITLMDRDIGRIVDLLQQKGIDKNTLVMFTSDNGPHKEGGNDPEFFNANGPLKGLKRALYEGGTRVPGIAWWPGKIAPGSISQHPAYFGDFMATAAEISGGKAPGNIQSISFLPTLMGNEKQQQKHEYLYWEFYEQGSKQSVQFDKWKAIRKPMLTGPVELYDLSSDLGEDVNIANEHPDIVARAVKYMEKGHKPDPKWKIPAPKKKK
jgi:uncharacterized sulfatase